jgi:glycine hydroxymethyltransferase
MDEVAAKAREHRPRLIIAGFSAYSRALDFAHFRAIADEVGAYLLADVAHVAGLCVTGHYPNPVPHAHVTTTTTHKTLRGPRSGLIVANDPELAAKIDRAVFPGHQGGPLEHVIAGKAVAFAEALRPEFAEYCRQIVANARALAAAFISRGYRLVSGGTDNHLFVVDVRPLGLHGTKASKLLDEAHITISKSTLPFDTEKILHGGGIRIGTPAITTRGMTEADMDTVASLIDRVLRGEDPKAVRGDVAAFSGGFILP